MRRRILALQFLLPFALIVDILVSVLARQRAGAGALAFFDDDFFYYLKIAINLAAGHGSTFDGIHLTNGYHPLWLLVLTGLLKFLSVQQTLFAVPGLICISALATYVFALGCFRRVVRDLFLASIGGVVIAFSALHLIFGGMEIVLTLPLALGLCYFRTRPSFKWKPSTALLYGFLASLVVLSRLDSIFFIAPLFALEVLWATGVPWSRRIGTGLLAAVGMLPIVIYVAANLHYFHVLTPISGMAKQLRIHHAFSMQPVIGLATAMSLTHRLMIVPPTLLLLCLAVGCLSVRGWKGLPQSYRPLATALMLLPVLQIASLSWISDWPIFEWYFYTFILAEVGAGLVLFTQELRLPRRVIDLKVPVVALLVIVMVADMSSRLRNSKHPERPFFSMYYGSAAIASFASRHPGIYAMGDRAGMPGYFLSSPLIQIEGLVMDEPFLKNIRDRRNLVDVMRDYGITYYVATDPGANGGCYTVREPKQAGPDSYTMNGTFCEEPVDHFVANGTVTDIFAIGKTP